MSIDKLEMKFDPRTVRHLGLKMYSHLPAALSEIISNAYDAYATKVGVILTENMGKPESITIMDDGVGLSFSEINDKFLIIGRNRREDTPPSKPPFTRPPTGKKGLGKLALFGVARTIKIETVQDKKCTEFILDYDDLTSSRGQYFPQILQKNVSTKKPNGTTLKLTNLKRKSSFDVANLIDNLSRIFIFDKNFQVALVSPDNTKNILNNEHKYSTVDTEFEWDIHNMELVKNTEGNHGKIFGKLLTTKKPITPSSGLRGITLYSRGKLVNLPEYFSESTSSHFYSYITGWINVDFIDDMEEDVISTNRQSLVWDFPEMVELRLFLRKIISKISSEWRKKKKERKIKTITEQTGINTSEWFSTLTGTVKSETQNIVNKLSSEDGIDEFSSVIQSLYKIVPAYAELHWRHLNDSLKGDVEDYYKNGQLGDAADQAVKLYFERMREMSSYSEDGEALIGKVYKSKDFTGNNSPKIRLNSLVSDTEKNIQVGQAHFSRGVYSGFRNPINHAPMKKMVPDVFSYIDCLNILSLVSYLMTNLDDATVDQNVT